MAHTFRRRAGSTTPEGRFIGSRIQDARRKGYTNREIASAFGMNERTVRKIISGETSGRGIYHEKIDPTVNVGPEAQNKSIVRLDLVIGKDADGNDIVRTVNAKTPLINGRTPTPLDVFRLPNLDTVVAAEIERLQRQYMGADGIAMRCERRGCGHATTDHERDGDTLGPCELDDCPEFVYPRGRLTSVRPIVRRDASKRLVTILGTL